MDFLRGLNPQQREAVEHTEGPLLILAGAGSGKTRVITHRIGRLIAYHRVPPSVILAVTFTNKAADEMRSRVVSLLGDENLSSTPNLSTFHSYCVRLLRRDGDPLAQIRPGFTRRFSIYDEEDQLALVKAAYRRVGLDDKFMTYRAMLSHISHAKNCHKTPADFYQNSTGPQFEKIAVVFEEYEKSLQQANALDFDDLLLESVRLLQHDDATRAACNRRIGYMMIDEYQDTNRSQYELMRLLSESHKNVCVVGDEDQSIYSWRGANIKNILDFEKDYPNTRTIRLERNYRSTKNILEAASALVANNKERKGKWLWTDAGEGERLGLYTGYDGENEALFIADTIERLLAENPQDRVAVLYRTNFQSRQIEEALRRYGRQYIVVGGFSFYQRAEIKDIVAYLKLAVSTQDSISLQRIVNTPARGIGRTSLEEVDRFAAESGMTLWDAIGRMLEQGAFSTRAHSAMLAFRNMIEDLVQAAATQPLNEAIRFIEERTGYRQMLEKENTPEADSRLENLNELANAAAEAVERGEGVTEFLDHAALVSDADAVDQRAQVSLLTLHNAKGLEFPIVFMAGMEEGLFPHSRSFISEAAMEEERRICYVGMTRAEKRLILSWARYRRRYGGGEQERSVPSRFLAEIPQKLIVTLGADEVDAPQVDLTAERHQVRQSVKRNTFTGTTYNSLENITQFFESRGIDFPPAGRQKIPRPATPAKPLPTPPAAPRKAAKTGMTVEHPKFGTGTVVRREGDGDDAKLTIHFPRYGLKKMVEKYAGLKRA